MFAPFQRSRIRWLLLGLLALALGLFFVRTPPPVAVRAPETTPSRVAPPLSPPAEPLTATIHFQSQALFAFVPRPGFAAALEAKLPAPARQVSYVRLNREWLEGKQSPFWQRAGEGRFVVPLPEGGALAVVVDRSEMLDADRASSEGHVDGQPASRVIVSYHRSGQYTVSIQAAALPGDGSLHAFALRATGTTEAQFYEVDESLIRPCGGGREPFRDNDAFAALARRAAAEASNPASSASSTPPLADDSAPHVTVDVMMLYTRALSATLPGDTEAARAAAMQTQFDNSTALVNSDFARSLISARVRLVKVAMVDLPGDDSATPQSNWLGQALTALRQTSDGVMDEVHALRNQVGADLVCLAVNRTDPSISGIAYVLQTPTQVDTAKAQGNDLYAFSVVSYAQITSSSVVSHELGHSFGCAHARGDAGTTGVNDGAYPYSYGYRFTGQDGRTYRTIMAYAPGTRVGYFSNPYVVATEPGIGVPVGVLPGQYGECYNALTIEKDAFEVAGYRLQQQASANPGTLVDVSTRAFVGTGEQQLIAGFFVDGAQAKQILVRAAGASLASFGVGSVLTNPKLTIVPMRGQALPAGTLLTNDDWLNQPGASALVPAAASAGAFPFTSSLDAALLVTLPPGGYSALVEGVGGTTGNALVEAYEIDRPGGAKLVSLSTRGYADKGKEMIAGFVIQGESGQTKRLLIRVQGPALAQDGVANAMFDPCLELHAADGTLLLANDDWTSGASSVDGQRVDFLPTVTQYSEQEIAATGYAPRNRREPAVLIDILPGAYSVVVKPFERLTDDPPQLAQPGVALVEVFEINP